MTIDTRGLATDAALRKTRNRMEETQAGDVFQIVGNDTPVLESLKQFLVEVGLEPKEMHLADEWILGFIVPEKPPVVPGKPPVVPENR